MQRGDEARKQFAAWLREVHRAAGTPSAAELERTIARNPAVGARAVSRSSVHRLLQGEFVRPPDWDAVTAALGGCVCCARPPVMLHIRGSGDDVLTPVLRLAEALRCKALDCAEGDLITPGQTSGWHAFQQFRDRVVGPSQ